MIRTIVVHSAALALALAGIEAEGAGVQSTLPRQIGLGEQLSNIIECAGVNRRVRSWRSAER